MEKIEVVEISETSVDDLLQSVLVVYNDDVNTFEWVIRCLCEYCHHTPEQAEQCALLIHHTGRCDVKKGSVEFLTPIKEALLDSGLTAAIE